MDPDETILETEDAMNKCVEYLIHEFASVRTGKASPALIENLDVHVPSYGTTSKLKGLAVISFGPWHGRPAHQPPTDLRYFLPMHIAGPIPFNLLGIWAMERCDAGLSYVGQVRAAIERYAGWLSTGPAVVAGDWNANAIWDRPDKGHTPFWNAVTTLAGCGLVSAYHSTRRLAFGRERQRTYTSPKRNPYHIDYCFMPEPWTRNLHSVKIGGRHWNQHSDHKPIIVDLVI